MHLNCPEGDGVSVIEHVTLGPGRLCIDCRFCLENGPPGFWRCTRPAVRAAYRGEMPCCVTARSKHFRHLACDRDGLWYEECGE